MKPHVEIEDGGIVITDEPDNVAYVSVAREDLEDFLVDLGEAVLQLGNADAKDFIKALIHAYRLGQARGG